MSDDDILEIARVSADAYLYCLFSSETSERDIKVFLHKFASAIAAKERDAIFKVCEEIKDKYHESEYYTLMELRSDAETGIQDCLNSIRARGEL